MRKQCLISFETAGHCREIELLFFNKLLREECTEWSKNGTRTRELGTQGPGTTSEFKGRTEGPSKIWNRDHRTSRQSLKVRPRDLFRSLKVGPTQWYFFIVLNIIFYMKNWQNFYGNKCPFAGIVCRNFLLIFCLYRFAVSYTNLFKEFIIFRWCGNWNDLLNYNQSLKIDILVW